MPQAGKGTRISATGDRSVRNPHRNRCHRHEFLLVKLADGVLRDELVLLAALRCAVSSPMAVRPVGGRLREGLIQGREVGNHAVNAGDLEDAEDGRGGDSQQQFAAFGLGAPQCLLTRMAGMGWGDLIRALPGSALTGGLSTETREKSR